MSTKKKVAYAIGDMRDVNRSLHASAEAVNMVRDVHRVYALSESPALSCACRVLPGMYFLRGPYTMGKCEGPIDPNAVSIAIALDQLLGVCRTEATVHPPTNSYAVVHLDEDSVPSVYTCTTAYGTELRIAGDIDGDSIMYTMLLHWHGDGNVTPFSRTITI